MSQDVSIVKFSSSQSSSPLSTQDKGTGENSSSLTKKIPKTVLENAMTFLTGKEISLASQVDKTMSEAASSRVAWSAVARNTLGYPPPGKLFSKWQALKLFRNASVVGEEIRARSLSWNEQVREQRDSSKTENTNLLDRFAAVSPFLFSDKFTLVDAINFKSSEMTFHTKEEVIKILLEREKPTAKELLAAVNLCERDGWDQEQVYQERKAFALKVIELLVEKGAKPDIKVLNKALKHRSSFELIKSLVSLGAIPDHETLDMALEYSPECVSLLLEKGARPSPKSLEHAFHAWRETRINDETLQRILKMHLEPENATISLKALENTILARAPLSMLQPLLAIAIQGLSEDKKIALMSGLLHFALMPSPDKRNENTQEVLNFLMNQVDHPTTKILNEALFRGQPLVVVKTLFDKGAKFDENSFEYAFRLYPSEEVVDFLLEKGAPFKLEMGMGHSFLASLPLPIMRKILPLVKQTSKYDAIEAMNKRVPLELLEKIFSLCHPLPCEVFVFALQNGLREEIILLMKKFEMQIHTHSISSQNSYSNSFNDALKYSADDDWIKFIISLGARPEGASDNSSYNNSYNCAVEKGASDFVLDYIKSHGGFFNKKTLEDALKANAPLHTLNWLVNNEAPFTDNCWYHPSVFSSVERFQLVYNYAMSKKEPLPKDFFDVALFNQAPLEVLEFILNEKIADPTNTALDRAIENLGRMPFEKLIPIIDKLLSMGLKFKACSLYKTLTLAKQFKLSNVEYFLDRGAVPGKMTYNFLFSREIPDDLLEMLMKIYLQMRKFSSPPPESLRYDAKNRIYIPVFPTAVAEPLESKAKV